MSVIIFIIILAILVLVHEFGHFIVAKKSGIRVDEFGLGFPPKIWSKTWNGTLYTLNAIPFGGFVKIYGEDAHSGEIQTEEDKKKSFVYKPKWIQAFVLVAGVLMNIIFAWFVISTSLIFGVPASSDYGGFGKIVDPKLVVMDLAQNSPAEKAGLKAGDEILSISSELDGVVKKYTDVPMSADGAKNFISENSESEININYKRVKEEVKSVSLKPATGIIPDRKVVGIAFESLGKLKVPFYLAPIEGARSTWIMTKQTALGLYDFLKGIFTFKSDFSQVSGPVGIAKVVGEARAMGFVYLLTLTAIISINLAIINMLPFPALDGGRLLFVLIESITRRPINAKFVRWTNTIGFAFLLILMLAVTVHDIVKLF
jgi:regulator of sigma E protease